VPYQAGLSARKTASSLAASAVRAISWYQVMSPTRSTELSACRHEASWWPVSCRKAFRLSWRPVRSGWLVLM